MNYFVRSLRTDVLVGLLFLISVASFFIMSYTYKEDKRIILDLSENYVSDITHNAMDKIVDILHDAQNIAIVGSNLIHETKDISFDNLELKQYMINTLEQYNNIDGLYYLSEDGNFLKIAYPSPRLAVPKDIEFDKIYFFAQYIDIKNSTETVYYFGHDEDLLYQTTGQSPSLDYRGSSWYKNLPQKEPDHLQFSTITEESYHFFREKGHWDNIHLLAQKKEQGISVSFPIFSAKGTFIGGCGVDISLKSLARFLQHQKIAKTGRMLILLDNGKIVASPAVGQSEQSDSVFDNELYRKIFESHKKKSHYYFVEEHEGVKYLAYFCPFPVNFAEKWLVMISVPLEEFLGKIIESHKNILINAIWILVFVILIAFYLSQELTEPIVSLANKIEHLAKMELDDKTVVESNIKEIIRISDATANMQRMVQYLSYFVPKTLVKRMLDKNEAPHLGGKAKELAVMFCDMVHFSSISEELAADDLMLYVSHNLNIISEIILKQKGTIDKYIGDNVMSFWGAPEDDPDAAINGCKAALLCIATFAERNKESEKKHETPCNIKIGLHYGNVIVGNIGSDERRNYTIIGDNVNLPARLETLSEKYGIKIIISEAVYQKALKRFLMRPIDIVQVKGKNQRVKIFELIGMYNDDPLIAPSKEDIAFHEAFTRAYDSFSQGKIEEAKKAFDHLIEERKDDIPTTLYLKQCAKLEQRPQNWSFNGLF